MAGLEMVLLGLLILYVSGEKFAARLEASREVYRRLFNILVFYCYYGKKIY